ncbi:MAG: hypothetical protein ACKVT1_18595 [Dehalococcoidia bacterium]
MLLLDPVSLAEVARLAPVIPDEAAPAQPGLPRSGPAAAARRRRRPPFRSFMLFAFFPLMLFSAFGLAVAVAAAFRAGSPGWRELVLLALLLLLVSTAWNQGLTIARVLSRRPLHLPGPGARAGRRRAGAPPRAARVLLLDLVSLAEVEHLALPAWGASARDAARARGKRAAGAATWFALVGAMLLLVGIATASLAVVVATLVSGSASWSGPAGLALVFLLSSAMGVWGLLRLAVRSVLDERLRQRRRLLRPLLSLFLRWLSSFGRRVRRGSPFAGQGAGLPGRFALMSVAAGASLTVGLGYAITTGNGDNGNGLPGVARAAEAPPAGSPAASPSPQSTASGASSTTPTVTGTAVTPTATPEPSPADQSAPPTPTLASPPPGGPAATPTPPTGDQGPAPTPASTPSPGQPSPGPSPSIPGTAAATATLPIPTGAATPTPPAPTPTRLPPAPTPVPPTRTPTPVPPTPTPTGCPADADCDRVTDNFEVAFNSDPNDPASTPEDKRYDAAVGARTCSDGIDNDRDGLTDAIGRGSDPGCR